MEQPAKQARTEKDFIATHSGSFHCDEALACSMLKMLPRFKNMEVVRSRDASVIDKAVIVVDVGGIYDPQRDRYDHHQRGFEETFDEKHTTKLSSAGLVYKHFGREILAQLTELEGKNLELVFQKIYDCFIEELDGLDNGIDPFDGRTKFALSTTLGGRVSRLNPNWNDANPDESVGFSKAMELTKEDFLATVHFYSKVWLPARDVVVEAIQEGKDNEFKGEVIILKHQCPWLSHIFDVEPALEAVGRTKYVIYQDQAKNWKIQGVPVVLGSFQNRLVLPKQWHGLNDEALSAITGVPDCIFVHANGYFAGNKTYEGILALVRKALELRSE